MSDYFPQPSDLLPLLPAAITAAVLVVFGAMLARRGPVKTAVVLTGAAFAVAHLITWLILNGTLPVPPVGSAERAACGIVAFAAVSIVAGCLREWHGLVRVLHYTVAALVLWYVLRPMLDPASTYYVSSLRLLGYVGITLLLWTALETLAEHVRSAALPLTLALVTGAAGQIFFLYGSAVLAQLMGTTSLALVLVTLGVRLMPDSQLPRPVAGPLAGLMACLFVDVYHFGAKTPPMAALAILAATPFLLSLSLIPRIDEMPPRRRFALQMSIVVGVVAVAFWIGFAHMPVESAPSEYDPGFDPGK